MNLPRRCGPTRRREPREWTLEARQYDRNPDERWRAVFRWLNATRRRKHVDT